MHFNFKLLFLKDRGNLNYVNLRPFPSSQWKDAKRTGDAITAAQCALSLSLQAWRPQGLSFWRQDPPGQRAGFILKESLSSLTFLFRALKSKRKLNVIILKVFVKTKCLLCLILHSSWGIGTCHTLIIFYSPFPLTSPFSPPLDPFLPSTELPYHCFLALLFYVTL